MIIKRKKIPHIILKGELNMKKTYEKFEMEIVRFEEKDVVVASVVLPVDLDITL